VTANQYRTVTDFEASLTPGQPVRVVWTNSRSIFRGQGKVAKINRKSVRVALTEEVPCSYSEPYPPGREIIVPLIDNIADWSAHNRVEPENGYPQVD